MEANKESNMGSNRDFNKGSNKESITSWMQAQRQTLEHMFSDHECLVRFKCLVTGSLLKSQFRCHEDLQKDFQKRVKIVRSHFKSNFRLDNSLWPPMGPHWPPTLSMDTTKQMCPHEAFMSNVMPSKMV